jgi:hypothetical protein
MFCPHLRNDVRGVPFYDLGILRGLTEVLDPSA